MVMRLDLGQHPARVPDLPNVERRRKRQRAPEMLEGTRRVARRIRDHPGVVPEPRVLRAQPKRGDDRRSRLGEVPRFQCRPRKGVSAVDITPDTILGRGSLIRLLDVAVVVGSEDGRLYLVSLADGKELWNYEIGQGITSSPAVADGRVVVGSEDGSVYCFGVKK